MISPNKLVPVSVAPRLAQSRLALRHHDLPSKTRGNTHRPTEPLSADAVLLLCSLQIGDRQSLNKPRSFPFAVDVLDLTNFGVQCDFPNLSLPF